MCYGLPSIPWGKVIKDGLEEYHVKRHQEEMRNTGEGMEENHKKMMSQAVKWSRDEILNNGSAGGTNDSVPDLSVPIQMSK